MLDGFLGSSSKRTPDETDGQDKISFQRSRLEALISEARQINKRSQINQQNIPKSILNGFSKKDILNRECLFVKKGFKERILAQKTLFSNHNQYC